MEDLPTLQTERVIEALDRQGVQYLLVGGAAALLHGASRSTLDLDLLPRSDGENLQRLALALKDLGAYLRVGGLSDDEARSLPVVLDGEALSRMEISTWRTIAGDVDVLQVLRDHGGRRVGYVQLASRATTIEVRGIRVQLAALQDIVASKRFADRDKDRDALPELERLISELDDPSG